MPLDKGLPIGNCGKKVSLMDHWKTRLDPLTTPKQKLDVFNGALRKVLVVSKEELNRRIAEDKMANADKPKRGPKTRK